MAKREIRPEAITDIRIFRVPDQEGKPTFVVQSWRETPGGQDRFEKRTCHTKDCYRIARGLLSELTGLNRIATPRRRKGRA